MALSKDWLEFVESFLLEKVEFVVVGAFALAFYRLPRQTGDIDLFVGSSGENPDRICRAIERFGFGSLGLSPDDFRMEGQVIQLGRPPGRIDVLTGISGVTFDEAWNSRIMGPLNGTVVPYLSLPLLIQNKKASGREKDLLDVRMLERLKDQ